jgi:hypothetical protein
MQPCRGGHRPGTCVLLSSRSALFRLTPNTEQHTLILDCVSRCWRNGVFQLIDDVNDVLSLRVFAMTHHHEPTYPPSNISMRRSGCKKYRSAYETWLHQTLAPLVSSMSDTKDGSSLEEIKYCKTTVKSSLRSCSVTMKHTKAIQHWHNAKTATK